MSPVAKQSRSARPANSGTATLPTLVFVGSAERLLVDGTNAASAAPTGRGPALGLGALGTRTPVLIHAMDPPAPVEAL